LAITEVYVDPSIAASSGTGTIGDPYGDLQYGLDTQVRDAVNGDRFNIKAGTDEILTATLSLATYGTPTGDAPLILQGYSAAQGDGGIGGIDGNGSFSVFDNSALDYILLVDLHCHNVGLLNPVIRLDNGIHIINCEIDNGDTGIFIDRGSVINCHIHNCDNIGVRGRGATITNCTLENGVNDFIEAIVAELNSHVNGNVVSIDGSSNGISVIGEDAIITNNSIYSSSGTGSGITLSSLAEGIIILSNICEGFSGVGGIGIEIASGATVPLYGFNAFFNNTTNLSNSGVIFVDNSADDQSLGSSPFTDAASGDFTVSTAVRALAYPTANYNGLSVRTYLDIGALQRQEPSGSVVYGLRRIPI
jgi:hypothetical protein